MIWQTLRRVLEIEAVLLGLPLITCLVYGDNLWPREQKTGLKRGV